MVRKKQKKKYWYVILSMAIVILIFPISINQLNDAVLKSAQHMGEEIAKSFAFNEEVYVEQYENILDTMEYQLRPEYRTEDSTMLIKRYLEFIHDTMDIDELEIYAVIDGKIKAATYWEGDETFNPREAEWYKKAIEAGGKTIFTDAYKDVRLNKKVVTLAKQITGTEDVAAVDIYPNNTASNRNLDSLPTDSNYYLCDSKGSLLDYYINGYDDFQLQEKYNIIFNEILDGVHDSYESHVIGIDGQKRGVYYYRLDSGWYSVITIPYDELLKNTDTLWHIFIMVMSVFVVMVILFIVLDIRTSRKARLYNEIVGVLGNSYYALYLINYETNQYFMLKSSDFVRESLPEKGDYGKLLETVGELVEPKVKKEFQETFSGDNIRVLVKKRVRDFGGDFRRKFNGVYRWVHVQMLYDESLQKNSVVLCFKDIHNIKEQELSNLELLKNSLESVDKMAKSKSIFFSQMSHDMRTPLNGIIGLADLIVRNLDNTEKTKESLEKIKLLSNQLLSLINDILEMSKIEEGKLELKKESFSLKQRLEALTSVFMLQTENKRKQFKVSLDIEDTFIEGDWGKIQQIINNLLSNGFKYTKEDGKIEFLVSETKDSNSKYVKYYFTVKDDGVGMSGEFLKKLFIPFERETQFGAANVSGTGLGMPIVNELVHKMDGTINVSSELEKGSTFEVMIPCRLSDMKHTEQKADDDKEAAVSSSENMLEGLRVLLAEDNEINMEIASEVLEMYGVEVVQAWNGKEAVQLFEEHDAGYFDLILMDMQMPVMDGCRAAEAIRKSGKKDAAAVPIIAVTANAFAEDIVLTKKAGMNAHISKPIDFDMLKETMWRLNKEMK